jgi:hypothetical protein
MEKLLGPAAEKLKKLPGMVKCYASWNAAGNGNVTAIYESEAAATAAAETAKAILGSMASVFTAAPIIQGHDTVHDLTA